jgi:hypothetical protein
MFAPPARWFLDFIYRHQFAAQRAGAQPNASNIPCAQRDAKIAVHPGVVACDRQSVSQVILGSLVISIRNGNDGAAKLRGSDTRTHRYSTFRVCYFSPQMRLDHLL